METAENKIKVIIIIPVYNAEKYIAECFYSIANQTYKNIEAIFVDDRSPDNSLEILQELIKNNSTQEIKYKLIKHDTNKNVSVARNTGILQALKTEGGGDYLFFMDSDDIITPNCIEYLLKFARKYPKAKIIQGAVVSVGEDIWSKLFSFDMNERIWNIIYEGIISKQKQKEFEETLIETEIIKYWLRYSMHQIDNIIPCGVWATLYEVDFIKNNNLLFSEDLPITQDVYFRYSCFKKATEITITYMPIYIYRARKDDSLSKQRDQYRRINCSAIVAEKILPDIDNEKYPYELAEWIIEWVMAWLNKMRSEKEKILTQRYMYILKEVKEKIPAQIYLDIFEKITGKNKKSG
jgi:glycosyltransferase involved in cell wall biosynthesis